MDHELKQRIIGTLVVTALAAIFVPMLFDDPVDTSGKTVTELTIPQAPVNNTLESTNKLPENKAEVLNRTDIEINDLNAAEINEDNHANTTGETPLQLSPDGDHPDQALTPESVSGPGDEPVENATQAIDQAEQPVLDTGEKQGANITESQPKNTETAGSAIKPDKHAKSTTNNTVTEPEVSQKPKPKPVVSTEKPKSVVRAPKEPAKKPNSKLVRYSIQAGSFNKQENAQSLVDKLRKQGMPATIVAKGDYFRVKIGPSLDKDKAKEMKAKLDKQNIKGLLVSE